MMDNKNLVTEIYRAVDAADLDTLLSYMDNHATFRFANIPAVVGKKAIGEFLGGFFQGIRSLSHTDLEYWYAENVWSAMGNVAYTRLDGSMLKVPFSVILKRKNGLIKDYLIFVDNHELFQG